MFGNGEQQKKLLEQQLSDAHRRLAELERELGERSRRHGHPLSVGTIDIDGFRGLNVSHGLAVGDAILRAAGRVITELTRANDFVARSQGDEFMLLMTDTDSAG